jgi:hypothetical protein
MLLISICKNYNMHALLTQWMFFRIGSSQFQLLTGSLSHCSWFLTAPKSKWKYKNLSCNICWCYNPINVHILFLQLTQSVLLISWRHIHTYTFIFCSCKWIFQEAEGLRQPLCILEAIFYNSSSHLLLLRLMIDILTVFHRDFEGKLSGTQWI